MRPDENEISFAQHLTVDSSVPTNASRFIAADNADRERVQRLRKESSILGGGILSSDTAKRWFWVGSAISVLFGIIAGLSFKNVSYGILMGVIGEVISLTLGLNARLKELESNFILRLTEHNELFRLVQRVAATDDPPLTRRFNVLTHTLWELKEGRYKT